MSLLIDPRVFNFDIFRLESLIFFFCQKRWLSIVLISILTINVLSETILFHGIVCHHICYSLLTFGLVRVRKLTDRK
jgi:uncharacterized membrane protein YiaA